MINDAYIQKFIEMSLALTSERDREALLSAILDTAIEIASCDAGTLYLLEEDGLHFCRMVTLSQNVRQGGHAAPITLPPVPLEEKYVASYVAIHGEMISIADVRTDTRFDFTGSMRYDEMTGYRTKSMLVVPMKNDRGELIGVTQLINALSDGEVVPFDPETELLCSALSSQAAISVTNMQYSREIVSLLDSLVGALSTAIDERTPYNANHTRNMVRYGAKFLDAHEGDGGYWDFDENRRRTFLMSVWLHDVGKLVVPLEVMDKQTRLDSRLPIVLERFRTIGLLNKIAALEGKIGADEAENVQNEIESAVELVNRVNSAGFLPDETIAEIEALAERTYTDENGDTMPWITPEERTCLLIRKGTLTAAERQIMESHVVVTGRILGSVAFPKIYAETPRWAAAHHEYLNGTGYPNHITAEEIPPEVRLLTILDVFDALTARDRPYKPGMPVERALSILHSMVSDGQLDGDILGLFEESRAWE